MKDYLKMQPKRDLEHGDLVAMVEVDPDKDAEQHGVKGQKWGIRRNRSQLKAAATKGETTKPATDEPKKVVGAASGESSASRYNRLKEKARAEGANSLDEQDLKFVNARTEAISKIQKMNQVNPGWLSTTSKKVLQQTAQNTMQNIADGVAKKYISGPVLDSLNKN